MSSTTLSVAFRISLTKPGDYTSYTTHLLIKHQHHRREFLSPYQRWKTALQMRSTHHQKAYTFFCLLGNVLILIALHKVTSIHPPTKRLFRCLALTDLCVDLISQPLFAIRMLNNVIKLNLNALYYVVKVEEAWSFIFCEVFSLHLQQKVWTDSSLCC